MKQVIVDDPKLSSESKLSHIMVGKIPGGVISEMVNVKGIPKVLIS